MGERVAGFVKAYIIGECHGKLVFWNRDRTAILAINDRDRAAPIALARDSPIAQAELGGAEAVADVFAAFDDFGFGIFDAHSIEPLGIH